jgi:hypothetical protein
MKTVVMHGKVIKPISPKVQYPEAVLWGCTHTQQQYGKHHARLDDWDAWFDLHPVEKTKFYPGIKALRPKTYDWYKTLPPGSRPLWMFEVDPSIPASVRFPRERILTAFPIEDDTGQTDVGHMLTCQVDWMMAHAILEGYEHIVLHGHGVSERPGHMVSHRGILYWIAVARGRGIRVTVHAPSWYRAPTRPYGITAGGWEHEHGLKAYRKRAA